MLTFHNAMSMKLVIGDQEVTVRACSEADFTQRVSTLIYQHPDKAAIEKELSTFCYLHSADKWACVNILKRRGISLVDNPSQ
jgi:hypothetical protein